MQMQAIASRITREAHTAKADAVAFVVLSLVSMCVFLQYDIWQQPVIWDTGYFLYMAQQMLLGRAPYAAAFDHKTPLSAIVAAIAMAVGESLEVDPLLAARFVSLALSAAAVGFLYLAAKNTFGRRSIALLSAIIMMSFSHYGIYALSGAEPKILMVLLGLIAIYAFQRQAWVACGCAGGLAALSWQPGLIFAAVPLLLVLGTRERSRRRAPLGIAVGACVPVAALALYLVRHGALVEAVRQTVVFNLGYAVDSRAANPSESLRHIAGAFLDGYGTERWFLALGIAGWIALTVVHSQPVSRLTRLSLRDMRTAPVLMTWYTLVLLSLLNFQWKPDAIPLLPYLALWGAWVIVVLSDLAIRGISRLRPQSPSSGLVAIATVSILVACAVYGTTDAALYRPLLTLAQQRDSVRALASALDPDDPILVFGQPEVLVLSGRTNALRYMYLYSGVDRYITAYEPGGMEALVQQLKKESPGVVVVARWPDMALWAPLHSWIESEYRIWYDETIPIDRDTSFFDPERNGTHSLQVKVYLPSGGTPPFQQDNEARPRQGLASLLTE
jgi:hypothetical protein